MMKKRKYMLLILLFATLAVFGQTNSEGTVNIEADPRIEELVELHSTYNKAFPVMPGYRIQVFMESGTEALTRAEEVKKKFTEKNKGTNAYLTFDAPYYRVRVGDFRTRLDAEKFLLKINRRYPNAWVIKDEINFPELSNNQKSYENE